MSPAELSAAWFPDAFKGGWGPDIGYGSIVEKFGTVLFETSDNDYEGSSFYLLADGDRRGYLEVGWGSCSGCDALQGCQDHDDLGKLCISLRDAVRWFDTEAEFLTWSKVHDWKGEWSWHDGATAFVAELNKRFGLEIPES